MGKFSEQKKPDLFPGTTIQQTTADTRNRLWGKSCWKNLSGKRTETPQKTEADPLPLFFFECPQPCRGRVSICQCDALRCQSAHTHPAFIRCRMRLWCLGIRHTRNMCRAGRRGRATPRGREVWTRCGRSASGPAGGGGDSQPLDGSGAIGTN